MHTCCYLSSRATHCIPAHSLYYINPDQHRVHTGPGSGLNLPLTPLSFSQLSLSPAALMGLFEHLQECFVVSSCMFTCSHSQTISQTLNLSVAGNTELVYSKSAGEQGLRKLFLLFSGGRNHGSCTGCVDSGDCGTLWSCAHHSAQSRRAL